MSEELTPTQAELDLGYFWWDVVLGRQLDPKVLRRIAGVLLNILAEPNHIARPAFGLAKKGKGRPKGVGYQGNVERDEKIRLRDGLARARGTKVLIKVLAGEFEVTERTVERALEGQRTEPLEADEAFVAVLKMAYGLPFVPKYRGNPDIN